MEFNNRYFRLRKEFDKRGFNHPEHIGEIMAIAREVRPVSEEDWYIKYNEYCNRTGLLANVNNVANTLKQYETDAYVSKFLKWRLIEEPFKGYSAEIAVIEEYKRVHGVTLEETSRELDVKYSVDLIRRDETGKIILAIQVKKSTGKVSPSQQEKMNRFAAEYGVPVITAKVGKCGTTHKHYISCGYEELGIPKYVRPSNGETFDF